MIASLINRKRGSILAIDADPNSCLAESLGVRDPQSIVGTCEDISKNLSKIPQGMTKDRYIEMRVQEAVTESNGFDLLVMGRPEGPGCYCYVNNLLRNIISQITQGYDFVVIDNAAGMEHISRRTTAEMNKFVLVSDYSIPGIRSAHRIYELAKELGIKIRGAYLVINKVSGGLGALKDDLQKSALAMAGSLPYDEKIVSWNISNKSIFEFKDKVIEKRVEDILGNLLKG